MCFAAVSLSACGDTASVTQNIKVTVTVVDGGKTYSGSAVQWMKCVASDDSLGSTSIGGCALKGEAVPVKIGEKGYLIMLLSGPEKWGTDPTFYPGAIQGNVSRAGDEKWELSADTIPILATFRDLKDSKTFKVVDPNALDEVFGAGVTLSSVYVERTKEPLTAGQIETILPWLVSRSSAENMMGEFGNFDDKLPSKIQTQHFIWR